MKPILTLVICVCTHFASLSHAHVVLEQRTTTPKASYKAVLKVGHGCDGSPTTLIRVSLPEGFGSAKPQPKAGWQIETKQVALATPYESHGRKVTHRVAEITWRGGRLEHDHYDEFVVMTQAPEKVGTHYVPVLQQCEKGSYNWAEVPTGGKSRKDYKEPAAELEVVPK